MTQVTIEQALQIALSHHQAGRLPEAEALYRQILARQPNHLDALSNLGAIAGQVGRYEAAVELFAQALSLAPADATLYGNLGECYRRWGKFDEAIAVLRRGLERAGDNALTHYNLGVALVSKGLFREALLPLQRSLELDPRQAEPWYMLGNACHRLGDHDQAIASFTRAIDIAPDYADAHANLGAVLKIQGSLPQALAALRRALELHPHNADTCLNLGAVLQEQGKFDEALAAFRQALALKSDYPEALVNLGNALHDLGQLDQALAAYRQALALKPSLPEAHSNLGNVLRDQRLLDQALAAYRQALALNPDYPEAYSNLGNVLQDLGRLDEALAAQRQALALKPDYPDACNNLGNVLRDMGLLDEALAAYRQALALKPSHSAAHDNLLLALHYHPDSSPQVLAEEHRRWNLQQAEPLKQCIQPHSNDRCPTRRLRIGYVSPDFRTHVVGQFLLPLLSHHDKHHFEIFAYAQVASPDAMTQKLRACTDAWRNIVGLSDAQAADLIRHDRIDILVDLALHTQGNRLPLFARKPAPVQVTWLGYAGSTGLSTIDYRLTDPYLDPPGQDDAHYSEQSLRLPHTFWCYQPIIETPQVNALPALQSGYVTFASLNNFAKVTLPALHAWTKILSALPRSRLLLHCAAGAHRDRVSRLFVEAGIAPERLQFSARLPFPQYFRQYHQVDLMLDPFPFGGGTTSCDALWMGVPFVTLCGSTSVGRAGVSLLGNLGLQEYIAHSPQEYVARACTFAHDLPRLSELRSSLRQRMLHSPLMNAPLFAAGMESLFRQIWQKWCAGHS